MRMRRRAGNPHTGSSGRRKVDVQQRYSEGVCQVPSWKAGSPVVTVRELRKLGRRASLGWREGTGAGNTSETHRPPFGEG